MVVTPGAGLQVSIAAGAAYVQQTVQNEGSTFYNGLIFCMNDAAASPYNTITAPLSNPRIDQVILRVYDVSEQGLSGSSFARFEWLTGTETSGANLTNLTGAAALPANSLNLAYVQQDVGEASIEPEDILLAAPRSGQSAHNAGATNIAAAQSITSTTYTTLATPDQVPNIVLPTNGLIRVGYQATWQESVSGAARAAIFVGANQFKIQGTAAGAPETQAATTNGSAAAGNNMPLYSAPYGLLSVAPSNSTNYGADVTTGQGIGFISNNGVAIEVNGTVVSIATGAYWATGGACEIFAAAGTYTISVQFKSSSGSVTASNRKLWVEARPYG